MHGPYNIKFESYSIAGLLVNKEVHEANKLLHLITEYFVERMQI
jgi:hypothetical protein